MSGWRISVPAGHLLKGSGGECLCPSEWTQIGEHTVQARTHTLNRNRLGQEFRHAGIAPPDMLLFRKIGHQEDIADNCVQDKVYEPMFVVPALPITGAVGSPVNPMAIKQRDARVNISVPSPPCP